MRALTLALAALTLATPAAHAAAQDGSGVERERTKATAQEFFTKATERAKEAIGVDVKQASSTDPFGFTNEIEFPAARVLGMSQGKTDCVTLVRASYIKELPYRLTLRVGNPNTYIFVRESGGENVEIGTAYIDWSKVGAVSRAGTAITVLGTWHFRFRFTTEELAQRFGQAMEFMRTQCSANTDDDLAF